MSAKRQLLDRHIAIAKSVRISFSSPFPCVALALRCCSWMGDSLFRWVVVRLQFLSFAFAGLALFLLGLSPLSLRRGLHSFAASRLGPAGFTPFAALRLGGRGV